MREIKSFLLRLVNQSAKEFIVDLLNCWWIEILVLVPYNDQFTYQYDRQSEEWADR